MSGQVASSNLRFARNDDVAVGKRCNLYEVPTKVFVCLEERSEVIAFPFGHPPRLVQRLESFYLLRPAVRASLDGSSIRFMDEHGGIAHLLEVARHPSVVGVPMGEQNSVEIGH